jgi:hypothetical protein
MVIKQMNLVVVKKRGRPPGSKNKKTPGNIKPEASVNQDNIPKKRGRPPKKLQTISTTIKPESTQELIRESIESVKPTEDIHSSERKTYKQFQIGDKVKKITNGEIGYVKIHKPNTRYVYVNWGGDYMDFVAAELLELVNPIKNKRKLTE